MWKVLYFVAVLVVASCSGTKKAVATEELKMTADREISFASGPQTIIYKTTRDFSTLVPVIMDAQRTEIISYPAPTDIFYNGILAMPTALKNGYWLDNRGINENVVFLSYTYEEYSRLTETPSKKTMLSKIVEKYPLTEMYNCGLRTQYKEEVKELNELIDNNFKNCRKIKLRSMSVQL